jgi:peptide chain release factor subunit 3
VVCGAQVLLKVKGIEEEAVQEGFVLCAPDAPCRRSVLFEAQLRITELPASSPIVTVGFTSVLHLHALATECTVHSLIHQINPKTGQPLSAKPRLLKVGDVALIRLSVPQSIACESFKDSKALGRFTLRSQGLSIAVGKIMRIKDV